MMNNFKKQMMISAGAGLLTMASVSADDSEYTAEVGKFEQVIKVDAIAMPVTGYAVSIKPVVWNTMKIEMFLAHGTAVTKGEKLVWIDTEALDEKIEEAEKERVRQKLELEKAELELEANQVSTAESLERAKLKYERFLEDYDYYVKVTKPEKASDVEHDVKLARYSLSYAQEELNQLLKMYEEDGLTEETEEIIIERTKHGLDGAERKLKKAELDAGYQGKIVTPRNDADWELSAGREKRVWERAQKSLPLSLKIKELDLERLIRLDAKAEENLTDLKADRALMEFQSPADGVVYFGEFKDGKWISEPAKKVLRNGGDLPTSMPFMTVVPDDSELKFHAFFSEEQVALYEPEQLGSLRLKLNPWKSVPVKSDLVSKHPVLSHQWLVSFTANGDLPDGVEIGSKAVVSMVVATEDNVLSVPLGAVTSRPDGTYSVSLKMAEGDPKETVVEVGRQAGDKLEILSGLENGQVILTP